MLFFDSHVHTRFSHDSQAEPEDVCAAAIKNGLFGVSFTDHVDCEYAADPATGASALASRAEAKRLKEKYRGRLLVTAGTELGSPLFAPDFAREICSGDGLDAVLLSVHAVRYPGLGMPFSRIDFGRLGDGEIKNYLRGYFNDLSESVNTFDFDALAHLTVPLRYIVKKYGREVNLDDFAGQTDGILRRCAELDKALEINASGITDGDDFLMPDAYYARRFASFGGTKLTLGSDAHTPERVAHGFARAAEIMRENGFTEFGYYSKRKYISWFTGGKND